MLRTVRPFEIFSRLKSPSNTREARIKIPDQSDLAMVETGLLIAVIQSLEAKRIFEFGTYLGCTTLNLALNSPADARVFTFDLPPGAVIEQHPDDIRLTRTHLAAASMAFNGNPVEGNITVLTGNSLTEDFSRFQSTMDFVFIDGGHDLATVTADTENALKMIRPGGGIAWHDYRNPTFPELSAYIESLPQKPVWVEETLLALWFA